MTNFNLGKSVGSQKSAQALDSPSYIKKRFITNKVTTPFFITLSKSIFRTSFPCPTDFSRFKKQTGVALITALLVVSLATVLAISLVDHLHFDVRRTENILRLDQAQLYNQNALEFAMVLLRLDNENNKYDSNDDIRLFNDNMALFPVQGGSISSTIIDLQNCFNLNNLSKTNNELAQYRTYYAQLLDNAGITSNEQKVLIDSLVDWLDADDITELAGAEFDYYIGLDKPYRTANNLMTSPSELNLVKGYNANVLKKIRPYVCVLPAVKTAININTAGSIVLESIPGLEGSGDRIITDRDGEADTKDNTAPFEKQESFIRYVKDSLEVKNFNPNNVQVYSEYFLLETRTQIGAGNIKLFSMIFRDQENSKTTLLRQSRGGF